MPKVIVAKRKKKAYDADHYRRVPRVDWDRPERDRLVALRATLDVTKYNLDVAHDEFQRAYKLWEYAERQVMPHTFVRPTIVTAAKDGYIPLKCNLCFLERSDERHGPVPPHPYVKCGASWRETEGVKRGRCFECGLPQLSPLHTP